MWKKVLLTAGTALAALLLIVAAVAYQTFGHNLPMKPGETFEGVHSVVDGYVQSFVVDAGDGRLVLVDAGFDPEAKAIKAELTRRHKSPSDVQAIFLTHGHADHISGVGQFPHAVVYAHAAEVDLIEGRAVPKSPASKFIKAKAPPVHITHALGDGELVRIGSLEVHAFHLPGHTAGSAAFLIGNVLFLGDSAGATKDGGVAPAPWFFSDDTDENRASLRRLAERLKDQKVRVLAFGHTGAKSGSELLRFPVNSYKSK